MKLFSLSILLLSIMSGFVLLSQKSQVKAAESLSSRPEVFQASRDFKENSTQGHKNWRYMFIENNQLRDLPVWNDSRQVWKTNASDIPQITATSMHPGTNSPAVRAWKSPKTGFVEISGSAYKESVCGGDGVEIRITRDSIDNPYPLWKKELAYNDANGSSYLVTSYVAAGDFLYFSVFPKSDTTCDTTFFDPKISFTPSLTGQKMFSLGNIKIVFNLDLGGSITELWDEQKQLVDHFDNGRLIQLSLYDGRYSLMDQSQRYGICGGTGPLSFAAGNQACWNPIEGGDTQARGSVVTGYTDTNTSVIIQSIPLTWNADRILNSDVQFEKTITFLDDETFKISYKVIPHNAVHTFTQHEVPAIYLTEKYNKGIFYDGTKPWTGDQVSFLETPRAGEQVSMANVKTSEPWIALVDNSGYGLLVGYGGGNWERTRVTLTLNVADKSHYMALSPFKAIEGNSPIQWDVYFYVGNYLQGREKLKTILQTGILLPVDLNSDGKVDIFDYNLLVTDFGKTTQTPADIDGNGKVDIFDYNILVENFGRRSQ